MTARALTAIAAYELRQQLWTPAAPLIALFLSGYNLAYSGQAEAAAEFGAAGVAANANFVVYLYSVGSCFWLLFLLVHMASVSITRDIGRRFAELTLSLPVSFRALLLGKLAGATLAALVVASAIPLSWIATSLLLPPDRVGPIPWGAMGHVYVVFIVPMVVASMAIYFSITARFAKVAAAYGVAFVLLVVWMLGVTVLFDGGVNRLVAQWIDPIGWVTVLAPLEQWTAAERIDGELLLTREIILNRALWLGLGAGVLGYTLATARPERWLGSGARSRRTPTSTVPSRALVAKPSNSARDGIASPLVGASVASTVASPAVLGTSVASTVASPAVVATSAAPVVTSFGGLAAARVIAACSWLWLRWQLQTGAARVLLAFSLLSMIGGGWAHALHASDGMKWPWTGFALPRMLEITFLPTALYLCFAAGQMVFRERHDNFAEVFDSSPRPRWQLAAPRVLAMLGLATVFAALLALGMLAVQLIFAPAAFDPLGAAGLSLLLAWPAFAELGAIAFLIYVLVRREWLAHALAFFAVFVLIVNHELGVVEHPLLEYAIPLHVEISPLTSWRPWLRPALAFAAVHLSLAAVFYLLSLVLWPRGFALTGQARVRAAATEAPWPLLGSVAAFSLVGVAAAVQVSAALHDAGEDASLEDELARGAAYERAFREVATSPEVVSVVLALDLHPRERSVDVEYTATLASTAATAVDRIDLDLPEDLEVLSIRIAGQAPVAWERNAELRHDVVRPAQPIAPGGDVELRISARIQHGALSISPSHVPLDRGGAWLTAAAVTPRIGYVREREIQSASARARQGLDPREPLPSSSEAFAFGAGATREGYQVRVSAPAEYALVVSGATAIATGQAQIDADGPIYFAVAALNRAEMEPLSRPGATPVHVLAHRERSTHARGILDRGARALEHLTSRFGDPRLGALWIVQSPRATLPAGLHGNVLMLPDEAAWDYAPEDPTFDAPLFQIASVLSQRWFTETLRPREVPGHAALRFGLPLVAALDALDALRGPLVAAAHRDEVELSVLQDIAAAAADLRAPALAETPVEGRIAGLVLHGLRQHHGEGAFDGLVRALLRAEAPSMAALTAALDRDLTGSGSLVRAITAIDGRVLRVAYSPERRVMIESAVPAYSYADGRWQPLERAPLPVKLAVQGAEGGELLAATAASGTQTLDVGGNAASVEIDALRVFIDRNRRDNTMPIIER